MKHNVLMIINMKCSYSGNLIHSLMYLEQCLNEQGGTVVYALPKQDPQPWMKKLHHLQLFEWSFRGLAQLLSSCREKYHIDIVHLHFGGPYLDLMFLKFYLHSRVRLINHRHNHASWHGSTQWIKGWPTVYFIPI